MTRWTTLTRFRLRRVLAGAALLTLALAVSGLLLFTFAVSVAPIDARAGLAAAASPFTGRPKRTPTPTPTARHTPTPTPTATFTPTPTPTVAAAASPTTAATAPVHPGASSNGSAGSNDGGTPLHTLLAWGLGALDAVLLALVIFLYLYYRRLVRESQRPAFAPRAQGTTPDQLNQFHQLWPPQEEPSPTALTSSDWMVDARVLEEDTAELPALGRQEPRGGGQRAPDGPEPGDFPVPR